MALRIAEPWTGGPGAEGGDRLDAPIAVEAPVAKALVRAAPSSTGERFPAGFALSRARSGGQQPSSPAGLTELTSRAEA